MNAGNGLGLAENFPIIRHMALNFLEQENGMQKSINTKRLQTGWDDIYLMKALGVKEI